MTKANEPLFETGIRNGFFGWQAWFRIGVQTFYLQPVSSDKGDEDDTKARAQWHEKNVQQAIGVLKESQSISRQQADPSVLECALQEILDGATPATTMEFVSWIQTARTIASKALTTYKESKPSPSITREQAALKDSVAEVLKENENMLWETCSGCHESEDGHDVGEYAFSEIFQCKQGSGCHECGGIGVVWNDYSANC